MAAEPRPAQPGDTVHVHYTGTLADGSEFDSSRDRTPLEFTLGTGQVVPGFERAVTGMNVGEMKTVTIPSADAYGPRRDELLLEVPRAQIPPHITPTVGQRYQVGAGDRAVPVVVSAVADDVVVLDGNHPLAGEDLTFALHLVDIR
jgi:peptidylprolyl isomerase